MPRVIPIKKPFILYIPKNIFIEELLTSFPIGVPNEKDFLIFLLHIIKKGKSYTQLNSKVLREKYFKAYLKLLNWLIDRGIIETDNRYSVFSRSGEAKFKGYRFVQEYNVTKKVQVITNTILVKKLSKPVEGGRDWVEEITNPNYGFAEDVWLGAREIAFKLNLKSNSINKGLRSLGLIDIKEYEIKDWFRYSQYDHPKAKPTIKFTEEGLEIIKELSLKYPELFPKKH